MPGFFDFIKKQPTNASGSPLDGQNNPQMSAQTTPQPIDPQPIGGQVVIPAQQSYNGIGSPANGQTSYNGIGTPPGGGQSYNGIGTPPVQTMPAAPAPVIEQAAPVAETVAPVIETPQQEPVAQIAPEPVAPVAAAPQMPAPAVDVPPPVQAPSAPVQSGDTASSPQAASEAVAEAPAPAAETPSAEDKPAEEQKTDAKQPADTKSADPAAQGEKKATDPAAETTDPDVKKKMEMDVMTRLTQRSNRVFLSANTKAKQLQNTEVDTEHLLHGLLSDPEIYKLMTGMKIQPQLIDAELEKLYKKGEKATAPQVSPRIKRILDNSLIIARKLGYEFISPEHLLVATYDEGEGVAARVLEKMGLNKEELNKKILGKKEGLSETGAKGEQKKSALAQYTIDLTAKAEQGTLDPCVGRSDVLERVIHILSRRLKNNPVLIGEPGVGKTAVVEGLAQKIVSKQVPEPLLNKKILQLDLMSVVAGASHRGEFEERMKNIVEEVKAGKGSIILFIDEIHNIVGAGAGGDGSLDASNFLKPALSRGEIQMIGATTITEYKMIEKDAALERRFQSALVPEPTEETAIKMLKALRDKFEAFHRVKIPDDAIEQAVKLSKRYMGDRFLPDKAVDLIDEAASAVRLPMISLPEEIKNIEERIAQLKQEKDESEKKGDKVKARILNSKLDDIQASLNEKKDEYQMKKGQTTTSVNLDIIKDVIAKRTGIPVSKISGSEMDKIQNLEKIMHERLIGQERPVMSVAKAVRRGRAGLKSHGRPIGSFVFLGPSGVGKTELAKTLADVLFGQDDAMIRFDMTEYMEKHEVAKLLGPPPGYVGYEEGGKLTEAVRRRQYSVVLFDEVEKAHPDIFNILLQILDDGRLTDNKGRTISFKNTVIICTSNIGTKLIQEELLKNGKNQQVEEPPVLTTYTFSPRGREIMTIGTKYFERDINSPTNTSAPQQPEQKTADGKELPKKEEAPAQGKGWNEGVLFDYFAGQKIEKTQQAASNEGGEAAAPVPTETEDATFPTMGYDSHAISSKGVEMISRDSLLFFRNSTTSKVWNVTTLIDYCKDGVVINALPDAPDEQLPTAMLKTHAFSPDEKEIVTYRDRFWRRKEGTNDWETGYLKDYFVDQKVKEGTLPGTHWDIHTFNPSGKEIIIVGETVWSREMNATEWQVQKLPAYFGKDFPLDKEVDEKNKIETESEAKKYDVIKEKVMNELLKFFRPELVNRFDEVIVFEPLKFIHMISIVKLQLKALSKLLEEQELGFSFTDDAVKEIVRNGFDPVFGARPLRRAIQRMVEDPISELIIAQKVKAGDFIYIDYDGEKLVFDIERTEMVKNASKEPKNFTKLDVKAFVSKFYTKDSDAVLKALAEKWPEYGNNTKKEDQKNAETPKKEEVKTEAPKEEQKKEGMPKDAQQKMPQQNNGQQQGNQQKPVQQQNQPQNGNQNNGQQNKQPANTAPAISA